MYLAEAPDPRQTQPRHVSGSAAERFRDAIQDAYTFFDTEREATMHILRSRPLSSGPKRDDGKVSQLLGFSSSLYGMLDGQFLELMIGMLGKEFSTHLKREVPKQKYSTTPRVGPGSQTRSR
jgi:hypothetical protein